MQPLKGCANVKHNLISGDLFLGAPSINREDGHNHPGLFQLSTWTLDYHPQDNSPGTIPTDLQVPGQGPNPTFQL